MTEADKLREYIAHKQAQMDDLMKKHGQGVRPGWVSEEIMMLTFYQRDAEDQLKQLEENDAANNPTN